MFLTMCIAFYIVPIPENMIGKIVFSAIWVIIGLLLSYFILGKKNMKRKWYISFEGFSHVIN